ncbi:MAG: hypothetical protein RL329_774 [Bacteroidota bacterium]|jgi:hypothetical protein
MKKNFTIHSFDKLTNNDSIINAQTNDLIVTNIVCNTLHIVFFRNYIRKAVSIVYIFLNVKLNSVV